MNVEINRLYEENQVARWRGACPSYFTLPVVWGLYRAFSCSGKHRTACSTNRGSSVPSLAGPSPDRTLAWLLPLDENYAPPKRWHDAGRWRRIVPVLTVLSQYVSMEILKPPKDVNKDPDAPDPNDSVLLQLLPLFIGYVSLTVPAGKTLYWLFNNVFTTATQVYLRQGDGAVAKIDGRARTSSSRCRWGAPSWTSRPCRRTRATKRTKGRTSSTATRRSEVSENVSENGRDMSPPPRASRARPRSPRRCRSTRRPRSARRRRRWARSARQPRDARAQPRGPRDGERRGARGGHRGVRSGGAQRGGAGGGGRLARAQRDGERRRACRARRGKMRAEGGARHAPPSAPPRRTKRGACPPWRSSSAR